MNVRRFVVGTAMGATFAGLGLVGGIVANLATPSLAKFVSTYIVPSALLGIKESALQAAASFAIIGGVGGFIFGDNYIYRPVVAAAVADDEEIVVHYVPAPLGDRRDDAIRRDEKRMVGRDAVAAPAPVIVPIAPVASVARAVSPPVVNSVIVTVVVEGQDQAHSNSSEDPQIEGQRPVASSQVSAGAASPSRLFANSAAATPVLASAATSTLSNPQFN